MTTDTEPTTAEAPAPAASDPNHGYVVVGLDGSDGSEVALDWAVHKSATLGPILPIATSYVDGLGDGVGVGDPGLYRDVWRIIREQAELRMAESLNKNYPDLVDRGQVIKGYPGPALVEAAKNHQLLVVGSRGRSALAETLLGSVASYCVKHATVPVAVIPRDTPTDEPLNHVLVGIDGSPNSTAALRWAVDNVAPGGQITALGSWTPAPWSMEMVPTLPEMGEETRRSIQRVVNRVVGETSEDVSIRIETKTGDARRVLRTAAADADLLVVGARGSRGVPYLLLGSVTTSLIHHPTVPTVVVPDPGEGPSDEEE